jgi:stearoyl-CoA desaturase (delta-9 desaturase)
MDSTQTTTVSESRPTTQSRRGIDWVNTTFLAGTLLIALIGVPIHLATTGFSWPILGLFAFYMAATGLSITGGYHRLFSHQSFQTTAPVRAFLLIFGAAACQNSALKWASDHRLHHLYVDKDRDPYNINEGFFYAHVGWVCLKARPSDFSNVQDLQKDPLVRWQHRYYLPLAIGVGGVVPWLFGVLTGDWWGGLLLVGVARTAIVHHSTFLINSLCHYLGAQPYSLEDSSRDSGLVALLTYGEGYHNFHHQFQYDYRNGIRWYHWDPTKWMIKILSVAGWATRLRTAQDAHIFKARLAVQRSLASRNLERRPREFRDAMEQKLHLAHEGLVSALAKWEHVKTEYRAAKRSMDDKRRQLAATLETELIAARARFQQAKTSWSMLIDHTGA